ncbi:MAG: helix-turn-helix domain-containing protein [Gammaproteobacteria bacterium]|nr:helix-turn-helix domain-containing protein [Gammaproteobacteria bacterium]
MNKELKTTVCTSMKWVGRAHCDKCHIHCLMLFSELPDSAFEQLLQPIDHFLHAPESVIYEAGTRKNFVYSIRCGMVKLVHIAQDGSYRIVRLLGPGAAIGLELLDGADGYHHAAIAINQVDLCKIPVSTIRQLESKHPKLYEHVGIQLQEQLDLADQWIVALGAGTAKQRVAQMLLVLNKFFADKNDAFIMLSGEDMAAIIGIAVETVSRMIAEFKRQKILYKTNDRLYTCNVSALQELSQQH